MEGRVKSFSEDKGYGFIEAGGSDYFLHITDIRGKRAPAVGSKVVFKSQKDERGPKAVDAIVYPPRSSMRSTIGTVDIPSPPGTNASGGGAQARHDRVICKGCSKSIVPRVITGPPVISGKRWTPVPKKSICPFCGTTYKEFSGFSDGSAVNLIVFIIAALVIMGIAGR